MTQANPIGAFPIGYALPAREARDPVRHPRAQLAEATCLDELLHQLQGNAPLTEDDVGLARLEPIRLQEIRRLALRQAESTRRALRALRRLLLPLPAHFRHSATTSQAHALRDALLHLYALNQELLRWRRLAAHAEDYLEQREVASRDARHWLREARARGEWPGAW